MTPERRRLRHDRLMRVKRLGWLGTQADDAGEVAFFFRDVLGLDLVQEEEGFFMLQLPSGTHDYVEVFGTGEPWAPMPCPRVCFVVDDVEQARAELAEAGAQLVGQIVEAPQVTGYRWQNFRAPDGHVYGVIEVPE
jgi:predicted enzyme related to lactoylglutathione lyase